VDELDVRIKKNEFKQTYPNMTVDKAVGVIIRQQDKIYALEERLEIIEKSLGKGDLKRSFKEVPDSLGINAYKRQRYNSSERTLMDYSTEQNE
jgi:hypothetical protein